MSSSAMLQVRAEHVVEVRGMSRYRIKVPIRAILDKPDGKHISVTIPAGALIVRYSQPQQENSTTLFGMVGVYWEDRHYSVYPNDLLLKAEVVQSA